MACSGRNTRLADVNCRTCNNAPTNVARKVACATVDRSMETAGEAPYPLSDGSHWTLHSLIYGRPPNALAKLQGQEGKIPNDSFVILTGATTAGLSVPASFSVR